MTDPQGRILKLAYDAGNHLISVTDPADRSVVYGYADSGNLATVTYPDGNKRQYLYAEPAFSGDPVKYPNELTGIIDEKGGRFESTTFSSSNKATVSQFAGGVDKVSVSYYNFSDGKGGSPASMTTPLGLSLYLSFADDGAGTLKPVSTDGPCGTQRNQASKKTTYDANGYPASRTDFRGTVTQTTYDANGLLLQQIEAAGLAQQRTTSTTWDVAHRQPLTQTTADAQGTIVARQAWTYNDRGQVTASCSYDPAVTASYACGSASDAPAGIRQTRSTYCDSVDATQCPRVGLLMTIDGPLPGASDTDRYTYYLNTDESGCATLGGACHRAGDLFQATDAAGHVTTVLAYDRHGRPMRQRGANGVITDVSYTERGWLASRTVRANADGSASSADATTTLTYEATGALKTVTDADGISLTYSYDDAHRLIDVADALTDHIHYTLDASGDRIKEETFDSGGVSRRVISRKYNKLGQLISVTDGLGHTTFDASSTSSYDTNGNLIAAKDALGITRKDTYDALDRLVTSVANANGTDTATKATTTVFAFDALNQLRGITDPDGLITTYAFDGLGNTTSQSSPDTGTQGSTYDAAGHPLTHTDAKGTVVTQTFDASGRRTSSTYADSKLNAAYHYDEPNSTTGCASSFPLGRLTRVIETAVTTVYCYDNQGRTTQQRQTQGTVTDVTDYVYTKAGRLAAVASPSGLVTEYGRNRLGQINSIMVTPPAGPTTSIVTAATYLPFGPVTSYTLGNGQSVVRTYDANYQVSDLTSPALNLHMARNASGDIIAIGDVAGAKPATETYSYDPLYRLTSLNDASGKAVEAYTYSRAGDRLSKAAPGLATGNYGYQSGSHWLTNVGTASRTYDANGSTTASATAGTAWGYGYNGRGQMTVVQQGGATTATYAYNALAQRVGKTVGGALRRFSYGQSGDLLGEYGTTSRDYVWMDGLPVGVVDLNTASSSVGYVHADVLGTPRAVTDSSGSPIWAWAYKGNPFGEAAPASSTGYALNLRYPGQYFDAESGLVYNHHRFYDPATGRYIQSDPSGASAGASTYGYVGGRPLAAGDPAGLQEEDRDEISEWERERMRAFLAPTQGPNLAGGSALQSNYQIETENMGCPATPQFEENQAAEGTARQSFEFQQRYLSGSGGRWGGTSTRNKNVALREQFKAMGFSATDGGGAAPEEWIRGPLGGTRGGRFADITMEYNGEEARPIRLRIQTVTTTSDGVTPTRGEVEAAKAIQAAYPSDALIMVPKGAL